MNIRPIQLTLFGDPAPVMMGGGAYVQPGSRKAKKGKIPRIL